jgi:hypothetical protein
MYVRWTEHIEGKEPLINRELLAFSGNPKLGATNLDEMLPFMFLGHK